ncbi:iron transporter [Arcobacter sp. CECT 8983]|uniref:FeoA family protein n=1 Tax=Arcobacter sp. CECT 8983 TaxID=2044508 RepID=UPI00100B8681|nr:FeoA family protein [Arcobacter sp. CECT 8983]RXJ90243.1 iron transporter [Arcobacter sp. CECT 8983]
MYLNELAKNECGKIISISCTDKLKARLNSFGITRNSEVLVIEQTLSKNTIEIKVNNTKIALRNSEAKYIEVEKKTCKN